jgi:hypothetical protein
VIRPTIRGWLTVLACGAASAVADVDVEVGNGDAITATLSPATEIETFRVAVPKGAKLTVKAAAAANGPLLRIELAPEGASATKTAAGRAPKIKATAKASGVHVVTVASKDGATAGDYGLSISWKSRTKFAASKKLAPGATGTLVFAADDGAAAALVAKGAGKGVAAVVESLTGPGASQTPVGAATAEISLTPSGDWQVLFRNDGTRAGRVACSVKLTPPDAAGGKVDVTAKTIGPGGGSGETAVGARIGTGGGTLVVPVIPPGGAGAEISGSSVTVPAGSLGAPTSVVISTSPPIEVPDAELGATGPTVNFGPEGLRFDEIDGGATAKVTLPYDPEFADSTDSFVIYTRNAAGEITEIPGPYEFDHEAHTVSFPTSHFSSFAAGGRKLPLQTLAQMNDPRDVCDGNDPSPSSPVRWFVAGGNDLVVFALRDGAPPGPPAAAEVFVGGGTNANLGVPRLQYKIQEPVTAVFTTPAGELWFATTLQVLKVDGAGNVQLVAGVRDPGDSGDNGPATDASLTSINSIVVDSAGDLYIADTARNKIRKVSGGTIRRWAGSGAKTLGADNVDLLLTSFLDIQDIEADPTGPNLYVADAGRIRRLGPPPPMTVGRINETVAGSSAGATGSTGDGGAPLAALFKATSGVTVFDDAAQPGDTVLVVTDAADHTIRMVNRTANLVTLLAGQHGVSGFDGDQGLPTDRLKGPARSATGSGALVFVDAGNLRVRRLTLTQ